MLSFIDYNQICNNDSVFFAHITDDGETETLQEHTCRCQNYFQDLYEDKNVENIIKRFHKKMFFQNEKDTFDFLRDLFIQIVSFHDFGKINPEFQRIKLRNKLAEKKYDGLVESHHSFFSALIYLDYFLNKLEQDHNIVGDDERRLKYFVLEHAYIIARHHSHLEDFSLFVSELGSSQALKLIDNLCENPLKGYKGILFIDDKKMKLMQRNLYKGVHKCSQEQSCFKFFYYRLAYSLLVASDYYATNEFGNKKRLNIIGDSLSIDQFRNEYNQSKLVKSIRDYEQKKYQTEKKHFEDIEDINDLRSEMFLDAERNLLKNPDQFIYFLEAPTGSGKSNTAFNLSFHLMQDRKKLFYIYPFNTLVEQNRETLNKLFSKREYQDQIVVVNSLTPLPKKDKDEFDDSRNYYQKLLLDRQFLNYPVILSTHVSFFNLLFGSKRSDVIGFHQLSEAVIVLDEIQSYRNKIWAEMIIMLKACAELMGMKIIMMSATLPNLEELSKDGHSIQYLLPNCQLYYQHHLYKERVKLHYDLIDEVMSLEKLKEHVIKNQNKNKKILIEFIKKNRAYMFYKMLLESEDIIVDVKCLTGDDSIIEREKILKPIKTEYISGLILISTQVIEAGVDIDMDIGYKDISLLDSEEQFLGRINRSCKKSGDVYFFDLDRPQTIYRDDYRMNESLTLKSKEMRSVLLNKSFSQYYLRVMNIMKDNKNDSTDENGLDYFFNENVSKLKFPEVSKKMKLIEEDYWSINVVLCRKKEMEGGIILDGWKVWNTYKELLQNNEIDYAKKQVKLIEIKSQLNYFVYQIKSSADIQYNDIIGELRCVEDASEFFVDGKLDRDRIDMLSYDFL